MHDVVSRTPARKAASLPGLQGNTFTRLLTARTIASLTRRSAGEVASILWPSDRLSAQMIERAATAPAMTTVTGWAAELAQRLVADMVEALSATSVGAQMLRDALLVSFDNYGVVSVPGLIADVTDAAWVAEGDPIPVNQMPVAPAILNPYKVSSIAVLTREMIESSNAEALVGNALTRAAGLALDAVLFDANPATAARPAGLRNGIAALTASSNTDFMEAFGEDIATLLNGVATVGGAGPYGLIANVGRAAGMAMRFIMNIPNVNVYGTPAAGTALMAVALPAIAAAISTDPEIEASKAATLHMSDTPAVVGPATSAPHKSMWQTDSIAVKVRWPASWTLRDPRGVAWLTPAWK